MSFNGTAIIFAKVNMIIEFICYKSKDEVISLLKNANLIEKSGIL